MYVVHRLCCFGVVVSACVHCVHTGAMGDAASQGSSVAILVRAHVPAVRACVRDARHTHMCTTNVHRLECSCTLWQRAHEERFSLVPAAGQRSGFA